MNTWNKFLRAGVSLLTMAVIAALCAPSAFAQVNTILSAQNFSSSSLPSGWSCTTWSTGEDGDWYWSSNGDGGSNGSAVQDDWEGTGTLTTPSENVSSYAHSTDSVWVDFDFIWEYNEYAAEDIGPDTWEVIANSDVLQKGTEDQLYTYSNTSSSDYGATPATTSSDWKHYHLLVPVSDRTSSMTITFECIIGWGESNPAIDNVTITGRLVVPAELSLEPHSYNFGTATPNSPDTLYATVKSVGTATLHFLANAGITGTNANMFSVISGPKLGDSLTVGSSRQYAIQFLPFTSGTLTATFTAYTDGGDSGTQSIALSGVGAVPNVSYSGVNNLFHQVFIELGDTSGVQSVPVSSTGVGPLTFTSISFIGLNPNNYIVTHMPQNPLPSGASDSISIRFVPTIEGRPDATLIINTNATNIPRDTVLLYGDGILPHLAITLPAPSTGNTTLSFDSVALGDSVCQTMTLTNTGSDTLLLLKQLLTSGDPDFTFYPLTGTDTVILPGVSKLVNVCFKPLDRGSREASLRFFTNIPLTFTTPRRDTSQFPISVTGVGVPYGQLVLRGQLIDTAAVGKTNCVIDTFVNIGLASLIVNTSSITGPNSAEFTMTATTPFTLQPGQSMPVSICFDPTSSGLQADTIWASGITSEQNFSDAFDFAGYGAQVCATAAPMSLPFGGKTLVTQTATDTVTVTNCGDYASTYTGKITVGNSTYSVPGTSVGPIAPGGTGMFIVTFTPTAIGAVAGNLEISGTEGPVANIEVTLAGVGAGVVATASGNPSAPVPMGSCDTFTVTVMNTGNYAWATGSGTITGANAADFSIVSGPTPSPILPSGTGTMMVSFCPTVMGTETMTLTFPNGSPSPIGGFSQNFTGVGASSGVALKSDQDGFSLGQSYPNPTNGLSEVSFTLPRDAAVSIVLLDISGQTVQTVFTGAMSSGDHTVPMDAKSLPSGTYFYTLTSGDVQLTRQMTIVR